LVEAAWHHQVHNQLLFFFFSHVMNWVILNLLSGNIWFQKVLWSGERGT
jgi:intracellular septation protein A